jgi:isopentenyl diphosphate isomerase/L-lactate dehydrogenase-like FMN-dependent dehydrogenase
MNLNNLRFAPTELSDVVSRNLVSTKTSFLGLDLSVPVLCPPMHSLYSIELSNNLFFQGVRAIYPRNEIVVDENPIINSSMEKAWQNAEKIADLGGILSIEISNGYLRKLLVLIENIKKEFDIPIIAGTIWTNNVVKDYENAGVDGIIVGNGLSEVCATSTKTGCGFPVYETLKQFQNSNLPIILAGGMRSVGDVIKSYVLGADIIYIGHLLKNCKDTATKGNSYWGEASSYQTNNDRHIEGYFQNLSERKVTSFDVIREIQDGFKSAMAFNNCLNLKEFRLKAKLERME